LNAERNIPTDSAKPSDSDGDALARESYLRLFLDSARNTKKMAERHLENTPTKAYVQTSVDWKNDLAISALNFIADGGDVKQFQKVLIAKPYAQGEQKGEVINYWRKKMLPQVFKWSEEERDLIIRKIDESTILNENSGFICEELGLDDFQAWVFGEEEDIGGRGASAFPLRPSLTYF